LVLTKGAGGNNRSSIMNGRPENRRATRYEICVSAEITTERDVLQSLTTNLSETGVCLQSGRMLEEGSTIDVSLFLTVDGIEDADSPSIDLKARVAWAAPASEQKFLAGCEFIDATPKHVETIHLFTKTTT